MAQEHGSRGQVVHGLGTGSGGQVVHGSGVGSGGIRWSHVWGVSGGPWSRGQVQVEPPSPARWNRDWEAMGYIAL